MVNICCFAVYLPQQNLRFFNYLSMDTNSRNISLVSYITLIGWVIALIMRNSSNDNSAFTSFHMRQSFGLGVLSFLVSSLLSILHLWMLGQIVGLAFFILMIVGILNANGGKETVLPLIGGFIDEKFTFIK